MRVSTIKICRDQSSASHSTITDMSATSLTHTAHTQCPAVSPIMSTRCCARLQVSEESNRQFYLSYSCAHPVGEGLCLKYTWVVSLNVLRVLLAVSHPCAVCSGAGHDVCGSLTPLLGHLAAAAAKCFTCIPTGTWSTCMGD